MRRHASDTMLMNALKDVEEERKTGIER